jgi:hypothetical protein
VHTLVPIRPNRFFQNDLFSSSQVARHEERHFRGRRLLPILRVGALAMVAGAGVHGGTPCAPMLHSWH